MSCLKNKISLYVLYVINIIKMYSLKIKYGKKLKFKKLLCLKKDCQISIIGTGQITFGEKIENRKGLYLVAQNGSITIGNHCFFNINCSITSVNQIQIGDECKFGNNVVVVDHDHNYKSQGNKEFISAPINIGNNVWVGAGSIILKGSKIGDNCVIAAGSIVKGEIAPNSLYYCRTIADGIAKPILM